jgi:putative FmdB family regulatory protein
MPIYEYRCSACGHEMEVLQKLSDPLLSGCPQCGKPALKKLLSAAGFQLKGSGWYATDFKGSGSKPAAKSTGDKDGGSKPAESKTESKEAKTDSKSPATETASSSSSGGGCGGSCTCH